MASPSFPRTASPPTAAANTSTVSPFTPLAAVVSRSGGGRLSTSSSSITTDRPWYKSHMAKLGGALLLAAVLGGLYVSHRQQYRLRGSNMALTTHAAPQRLLSRRTLQHTFPYLMLTVLDDQGQRVYEGNVMTFYGHPHDYVGVTPQGFEIWNVDTIFAAQNKAQTPLLFTRSFENVQDDIWIPYFMQCPVRRLIQRLKFYDWQDQIHRVKIKKNGSTYQFFVDKKPVGTTLRYLDGKGRRRMATLEGTV